MASGLRGGSRTLEHLDRGVASHSKLGCSSALFNDVLTWVGRGLEWGQLICAKNATECQNCFVISGVFPI
jgi:hypothetical protein